MRKILIATLLAGTSLGASAAAQDSRDIAEFQGQYELQDGTRLTVRLRQHQLMAELNDAAATPLSATGPATFSTTDGQLRIAFIQAANGNVSGVTLTRQQTLAEHGKAANVDKKHY